MTVYFVAFVAGAMIGAQISCVIWLRAFNNFVDYVTKEARGGRQG